MLVTCISKLAKEQAISKCSSTGEKDSIPRMSLTAEDIGDGEMVFALLRRHVSSEHVNMSLSLVMLLLFSGYLTGMTFVLKLIMIDTITYSL
jgi:hypothetical protein